MFQCCFNVSIIRSLLTAVRHYCLVLQTANNNNQCLQNKFFFSCQSPDKRAEEMPTYQKNQRVEGYYDDGYYPAIIFEINPNGSYVVHFDDGDVLEDMVDSELRLPQDAPETFDTADSQGFSAPEATTKILPQTSNIAEIPAFKPKQQQPQVDVQVMLSKVEAFLLPKSPVQSVISADGINEGTPPAVRLMKLLHEMSIGEHIRALQFLYRDGEDDLKLAMDIRNSGRHGSSRYTDSDGDEDSAAAGRITSKKLMGSITEGRCRAVALSRMCYGDDTIESLKALVDLSNIYAVQGRKRV
jgi:hypothetical protein